LQQVVIGAVTAFNKLQNFSSYRNPVLCMLTQPRALNEHKGKENSAANQASQQKGWIEVAHFGLLSSSFGGNDGAFTTFFNTRSKASSDLPIQLTQATPRRVDYGGLGWRRRL
jgi:hypothetical protein